MGKNTEAETATSKEFNALLDSLPSAKEDAFAAYTNLIAKFPDRTMSNPERRGGLTLDWNHTWPFYDVTFHGWTGAAGTREGELIQALRALGDEAVDAAFTEAQGYAQVRVSIDYGALGDRGESGFEVFRKALNLIRPYRVDSGYTWVEYPDVEEALRG
jgi:hypothetical protein